MAQTASEIIRSGRIEVKDGKDNMTIEEMPAYFPIGKDFYSSSDMLLWFEALSDEEQLAVLQKSLAQMIIDIRAKARGEGKEQNLVDGKAQERVTNMELKPQKPAKTKKLSLEEEVAKMKAEGKSKEDILEILGL